VQHALLLDWFGFHVRKTEQSFKPWVAQITGFDCRFGLQRKFALGKLDLSQCNKKGTRGARLAFYLPAGLYEVCSYSRDKKFRTTKDQYFIACSDGRIRRTNRQWVNKCLEEQSRGWAAMSSMLPESESPGPSTPSLVSASPSLGAKIRPS
jgi:hypothetical protein